MLNWKDINNTLKKETNSLKFKLISTFLIISIIPFFVTQIVSYYSITDKMKSNMQDLVNSNLIQTQKSLQLTLDSYDDLLYQIYTNEDIINVIENINNNNDVEVNINMLRRQLKSLCNTKSGVQALTIMTRNGEIIFYDKLSSSFIKSNWMNTTQYTYENVIKTDKRILIPTRFATAIGKDSYYLFHMAHRFIKYTNIYQDIGIIVISVDSKVLNEICNENNSTQNQDKLNGITYIYDKYRNIIYFPDRKKMGRNLSYYHLETLGNNRGLPIKLMENNQYTTDELEIPKDSYIGVTELYDENTDWTIAHIHDQSQLYNAMAIQQRLLIIVSIITIIALIIVILVVTKKLTSSIIKVVKAMKSAEKGELSVQIDVDKNMPQEISIIAKRFNKMMTNINELIQQVTNVTIKQKESEIKALEAQINPHFLYNTLDTINWRAIEKEEYEISTMINSLARILRYAVQNSNGLVTVRDELEWVKQYIGLQQSRLNVPFQFILDVDERVLDCMIHKLIFQPFLENSIVHGFENVTQTCILKIQISDEEDLLKIIVSDNGKGMSDEALKIFGKEELSNDIHGSHIGVNNVIGRLRMYYDDNAKFSIQSQLRKGTEVSIVLPKYLKEQKIVNNLKNGE